MCVCVCERERESMCASVCARNMSRYSTLYVYIRVHERMCHKFQIEEVA